MTVRILGTGSRHYDNPGPVLVAHMTRELNAVALRFGPGTVLVHGRARGADRLMAQVWQSFGLPTEEHPADWEAPCREECDHGGRRKSIIPGELICPMAGFYRNQRMVDLGAMECHAFPLGKSRGTRDCVFRAQRAGIPTFEHLIGPVDLAAPLVPQTTADTVTRTAATPQALAAIRAMHRPEEGLLW